MKIAIAMSGGVDSSVAAKILKDEGHQVVGLFLKLWSDPTCSIKGENKCCDYEALDDARAVAAKLNIPFYVINARDEFKKEVVDYFLEEYKALRTPNPCVVCNDKIKFGLLLKRAMEIGCDYLATGHYARIGQSQISNLKSQNYNLKLKNCHSEHSEESQLRSFANAQDDKPNKLTPNSYKLFAGIDKTKDQSYMLYHLNQKQLSKVMFPLGEMKKVDVRKLAAKWDLPVKEKPESQEICFFGDKDYRSFLKRYLSEKYFKPGEIVDRAGNVLGEHQGLINYTIGQRKGIEQISNSKFLISNEISNDQNKNKIPLYVAGFDIKKNQLIVGADREVYSKSMTVIHMNWIDLKAEGCKLEARSLSVKIRYRHEAVSCSICHPERSEGSQDLDSSVLPQNYNTTIQQYNNLLVVFDKPQRAVTPGQSAVFYNGDEVLGGGIIK